MAKIPKAAIDRLKRIHYLHNTTKNPYKKSQGMFAMDVEPAGQYFTPLDRPPSDIPEGFIGGTKEFKNPLVIPEGGAYDDPTNWKRELSKRYGGKTGKALTNAIRKDGYDAIITQGKYGPGEAVDLYKGKGGVDMPSALIPAAGAAALGAQSEDAEAGIASTLARLGYYVNNAADGSVSLYKKSGEKVGSFEYVDDAVNAALADSGKALPSGSMVDAQLVRKGEDEGIDYSYRGGHSAPVDPEYTAPLHDLTQIYPADIYSSKGAQYYGHGSPEDKEAFRVINAMRGQPEAMAPVFRAVPMDAPDQIFPGDWVTTNEAYARQHGEGLGNYKILRGETEAKRLRTEGNSPHEFGYTGFADPRLLAGISAAGGGAALAPAVNPYSPTQIGTALLQRGGPLMQQEAIPARFPALHRVANLIGGIQDPTGLALDTSGTADYLRNFGEGNPSFLRALGAMPF